METIYLSQLPKCLQKSLLVKKILNNDSENSESDDDLQLSIPKRYIPKSKCSEKSKSIKFRFQSLRDFEIAIDVLRYWMVDNLPGEIYDYMFLPDAFSEICEYRYNLMDMYNIPECVINFFDKFNDYKVIQEELVPLLKWRFGCLTGDLIAYFSRKGNIKMISVLI